MTLTEVRQALARGYCHDENQNKVLDGDLIEAMAIEIMNLRSEPLLGLATTAELIDEVRARIEVDGKLEYRTVDIDNPV